MNIWNESKQPASTLLLCAIVANKMEFRNNNSSYPNVISKASLEVHKIVFTFLGGEDFYA